MKSMKIGVPLAALLLAGCGGGGGGGIRYALRVLPPRASTTTEGAVELQSYTVDFGGGVAWRVREGEAGGTVALLDPLGQRVSYTAPATPGTYHVVARGVPREGKVLETTVAIVVASPSP